MHLPFEVIAGDLQLFGTYRVPLHLFVLVCLLGIAAMIDVRERRIPNWLVGAGVLLGSLFHVLGAQGMGIAFALSGLAVGLVALFPLYALGVMGAGDVKLMGMIGAFLGMSGVAGVILASMAAGGILSLGIAACKRMLPELIVNIQLMVVHRHLRKVEGADGIVPALPSVGNMPYAVAILAGTLIQLFLLRY